MMSSGRSSRLPFTTTQWQELEHQALVFKYMASGIPIPQDLLFTIRTSFDSSISSQFLVHHPQHIGYGYRMGFGRKIDPEPGRCRRTDGKKWRCSKDAYPDSKYCERHMHRGRNRSRKPVEIPSPTKTITSASAAAIPINNNTKNTHFSSPSSPTSHSIISSSGSHFLYPHLSSSRTPPSAIGFYSPAKDYRNNHGHGIVLKGENNDHASFFSEASSNSNISDVSSVNDSSWQLSPLTMGSPMSQMKHKPYSSSFEIGQQQQQLQSQQQGLEHHYYNYDSPLNVERGDDHQPKKVMHHFLDEYPPKQKDSWTNSEDQFSSQRSTQLSMSIPNSMHDFFMSTPK